MARIPTISKLSTEDFKDQASWIGQLLTVLNTFMTGVLQVLNKGITFTDNFNAQIKQLDFVMASDAFPLSFSCTLSTKPTGLWIMKAEEVSGTPAILTSALFADWSYSGGAVAIRNISGLTNGHKYRISVIIVAG